MVNDNPENSLHREVDNIKSCQNRMRQTLEQVNHQLGVNRNARHQLERDLQNKDHAIGIDHSCHQVNIIEFTRTRLKTSILDTSIRSSKPSFRWVILRAT